MPEPTLAQQCRAVKRGLRKNEEERARWHIERDLLILRLHDEFEWTFRAIGEYFDISGARAQQIHKEMSA